MSNGSEYGQGQGTLSKAAGLVTTAKADFDQISANMSGKILGMQSQWAGQGGRAFFQLHQAWTEKQGRIVRALDDFAESLGVTERDNLSTDESQSANMVNINRRLDG